MLDRKWVYHGDDRGDMAARDLRSKMQLYLLWKFVLSADVVFMELVMRLDYEPYNRERFHEVYYPAVSLSLSLLQVGFWRGVGVDGANVCLERCCRR